MQSDFCRQCGCPHDTTGFVAGYCVDCAIRMAYDQGIDPGRYAVILHDHETTACGKGPVKIEPSNPANRRG